MTPLIPLLIRTFGRTGSTLLMQVLGTSDKVCFERQYPFEHRYLTYVHNVARVIGTERPSTETWNNDTLFRGQSEMIGGLPYGKVEALDRQALARDTYVALWGQFSGSMRAARGIAPEATGFYAEKVPGYVVEQAGELLGARSVFLLRDPRDELVSIKSFNAKRGFHGFGWTEDDTDMSYARKMCRMRRPFLQNLVGFETTERHIAVRYEDLIRRGPDEVTRLSEWLGSPMDYAAATRDRKIKAQHMTSKNPASSVERWHTELGADVKSFFAKELGEELATLGYTV